METKHTLDTRIEALETELTKLRLTRSADIRAAHTFTAADYRIRLINDDMQWSIEDIMGELPGEGDSPSVFETYRKLRDIEKHYKNDGHWQCAPHGDSFMYIAVLEEKDPETGEWKHIESVGGLHHFGNDPREQLFENARDMVQEFLPYRVEADNVSIEGA